MATMINNVRSSSEIRDWMDRRNITAISHDSPNGEFRSANILDTETDIRRVEIATDGTMEEISFSSGRTEEWRRTCPGTSCHEWFTTYRVTGASWTMVTNVDRYGRRWATLHSLSKDIMSLDVPNRKTVRETAETVEMLLDPVQGCLDLAVADAVIAKRFPGSGKGLSPLGEGKKVKPSIVPWWGYDVFTEDGRLLITIADHPTAGSETLLQDRLKLGGMTAEEIVSWLESKGVKFRPERCWFKVVADLERQLVRVHCSRHARDMRNACLDGNYGREPVWTIQL